MYSGVCDLKGSTAEDFLLKGLDLSWILNELDNSIADGYFVISGEFGVGFYKSPKRSIASIQFLFFSARMQIPSLLSR